MQNLTSKQIKCRAVTFRCVQGTGSSPRAVPAKVQEWPTVGVLELEVVTLCDCLQTKPGLINSFIIKLILNILLQLCSLIYQPLEE